MDEPNESSPHLGGFPMRQAMPGGMMTLKEAAPRSSRRSRERKALWTPGQEPAVPYFNGQVCRATWHHEFH